MQGFFLAEGKTVWGGVKHKYMKDETQFNLNAFFDLFYKLNLQTTQRYITVRTQTQMN